MTKFSKEQFEVIKNGLLSIPEEKKSKQKDNKMTKLEMVKKMQKIILKKKREGYTLATIAEHLTSLGMKISSATLKNYLHQLKPKRSKGNATGSEQRQGN